MTARSTPPTPRAAPRSPAEIYAHAALTGVVLVGATVLVGLGRLDPRWWLGVVALSLGWLAPAVVYQLVTAYGRALYAPPPGSQPAGEEPAPAPPSLPLPPPGSLALLLAAGAVGRALVARGLLSLGVVGAR